MFGVTHMANSHNLIYLTNILLECLPALFCWALRRAAAVVLIKGDLNCRRETPVLWSSHLFWVDNKKRWGRT